MDLFAAIDKRHSVRLFREDAPEREVLEKLLAAAVRAPTAGNIQPWHFYVVQSREMKEKLSVAALSQRHVRSAPVVIVVCVDENKSAQRYGKRGEMLYCIQDAAAATENLLLAAVAAGLGGCWVGAFDENEVRAALGAPKGHRPVTMIPLGYPAGPGRRSTRMDLAQTVTFLA